MLGLRLRLGVATAPPLVPLDTPGFRGRDSLGNRQERLGRAERPGTNPGRPDSMGPT
jgi:hypothetical protein